MPFYSVSYDLHEGESYGAIIGRLEELGAVRALESFWLVELADVDAGPVKDHLAQYLPDAKDKLMVIQFERKPRFTRAFSPAIEWIQERFP